MPEMGDYTHRCCGETRTSIRTGACPFIHTRACYDTVHTHSHSVLRRSHFIIFKVGVDSASHVQRSELQKTGRYMLRSHEDKAALYNSCQLETRWPCAPYYTAKESRSIASQIFTSQHRGISPDAPFSQHPCKLVQTGVLPVNWVRQWS